MSWLDDIKFNNEGLIPAIAQDHVSNRVLMVAWMNAESLKLTVDTKTAVYFSRSRQKLWKKGETSGHTQQVHSIRLDCDADVIVLSITQIGNIACHTGRESCFFQELNLSGGTPKWESVDPVIKEPNDIYGKNGQKSHEHTHSHIKNSPHTSVHDAILSTEGILSALDTILIARKSESPDSSYVASLYHKGLNKILEKVGEESVETIIAAKEYQQALHLQKSNGHESTPEDLKADVIYEVADLWFHTMVTLAWFDISSDSIFAELSRRFGLSGIDEKNARSN